MRDTLKRALNITRKALYTYYSAPPLPTFRKLRNGIIYFSVGLTLIYLANISLQPSLAQELVVGSSMILCAIGFFITMMAYTRLLISRIVTFFSRKP